ncbi:MAG: hypothetical protein Homavirus2_16 [Homavirus sp.]|uniref:Uncharacterized protein n=1 Tax=Homavirus sp. TaxID=2487769 RepID=A0A3G5A4H6_9VIRU|nr:MAG: hypothetical protein Homavirus2_16 [Homavirus sp.]
MTTQIFEEISNMTPSEQHKLLLHMIKSYNFGGEGSMFHFCESCHCKDFERGGWGTSNYQFDCCDRCTKEYCDNCIETKNVVVSIDENTIRCIDCVQTE